MPPGSLKVGPFAGNRRWSTPYRMTDGGCCADTLTMSQAEAERETLVMFNTMVLRDGINPADAHRELWLIDEYRAAICVDTPPPDEVEE